MKYLLISLLAMTSCAIPQVDPVTKTVMNQNTNLQKKYHLKHFGFGTIGPGNKVYILENDYYYTASVDEARLLLVNYVENLKNSLNHDFMSQGLHSTIDEHFFSVSIGFKDSQGKRIYKEGQTALIALNKGMVSYNHLLDERSGYQTFYQETYQEALRLVQEGHKIQND
jgi:hypothetical protein